MDITKQYDKACEAVERGNDDYAVQLFQDILSIRPDHLESRKKLRETVKKKFRKAGVKSAGSSAYFKGLVPLIKMNIANLTKKYDQVLVEAEKFLTLDPDNKMALSMLGSAAAKVPNCLDTAIWAYESILENDPTSIKALQKLGQIYEMADDVHKASDCYEKIIRIKPTERDVEVKLRDLAARKTIKAGWDQVGGDKGDFKKVVRNSEQMQDRSGEEEVIRTEDDLSRNIERVKKDIEAEPDNKKYVIQLGDLYRRGKRYEEATAQYNRAKEIDPNDYAIDERLGDLQIEKMNNKIEELQEAVRKGQAQEGAEEKIKQLIAERDAFATEEYRKRVQLRPTDLPLRYKLGVLLYSAGDIDGALAEFQQAVKSPQHKRSALTYCGNCLLKKGMYDMSVQMFEQALQGSITIDRTEKNILYSLGVAAEKLGDLNKAEDSYKKIFNADINFRDVKDKIEGLYKKREAQKESGNEA